MSIIDTTLEVVTENPAATAGVALGGLAVVGGIFYWRKRRAAKAAKAQITACKEAVQQAVADGTIEPVEQVVADKVVG